MDTNQKRVYLWAAPRCLSTAFFRAIHNAPGTLGIFEPFMTAFTYGEERQICRTSNTDKPGYKFRDIVSRLEQPYTGHDIIFVKDMAYSVTRAPYQLEGLIPKGYVHTFLIRDPRESIRSVYKLSSNHGLPDFENLVPENSGYKDMYELYTYVTKQMCQQTIIIDAGELLENPETVLSSYCEFVGIPFHRCMIDWELADSSRHDLFKEIISGLNVSWFKNASNSMMFHRKASPQSSQDVQNLPKIVQDTINEQMPYYELLHEKRCTIHQHADKG